MTIKYCSIAFTALLSMHPINSQDSGYGVLNFFDTKATSCFIAGAIGCAFIISLRTDRSSQKEKKQVQRLSKENKEIKQKLEKEQKENVELKKQNNLIIESLKDLSGKTSAIVFNPLAPHNWHTNNMQGIYGPMMHSAAICLRQTQGKQMPLQNEDLIKKNSKFFQEVKSIILAATEKPAPQQKRGAKKKKNDIPGLLEQIRENVDTMYSSPIYLLGNIHQPYLYSVMLNAALSSNSKIMDAPIKEKFEKAQKELNKLLGANGKTEQ